MTYKKRKELNDKLAQQQGKSLLHDSLLILNDIRDNLHQLEYRHGWTALHELKIYNLINQLNTYLNDKSND